MLRDECPRCGNERLCTWSELNDQEQDVVRRLPGSADYPIAERVARHRWCTRCWFEAMADGEQLA